jgi:hypothetical protein
MEGITIGERGDVDIDESGLRQQLPKTPDREELEMFNVEDRRSLAQDSRMKRPVIVTYEKQRAPGAKEFERLFREGERVGNVLDRLEARDEA